MINDKPVVEHLETAVEKGKFEHVMAITLDPRSGYKEGVVRCITSRRSDVQIKGFRDRSELHKVSGSSLEHFKIGRRLEIGGESSIVQKLSSKDHEFIGLEDPDIWIDEKTGQTHLYFTMPFLHTTPVHLHKYTLATPLVETLIALK